MKKRDENVNLIKTIACFIVIGVHVLNLPMDAPDKSIIAYKILLADGVTIFFMASGFFMLSVQSSFLKLLKKTAKNILLPTFIVALFCAIFDPYLNGACSFTDVFATVGDRLGELFLGILSWELPFRSTGHLWYIFSYFEIVLMFPLLRPLCEKGKEKWLAYVVIFNLVGLIIIDIKAFFDIPVICKIFLTVPVIEVLAGHWFYKNREVLYNEKKKITMIVSAILFLLVEGVRYLIQYYLYEVAYDAGNIGAANTHFLFWNTSLSVFASFFLIALLYGIPMKGGIVSKCIATFAECSFFVYLFHQPIRDFLESRGMDDLIRRTLNLSPTDTLSNLQELCYFLERWLFVLIPSFLISYVIILIRRLRRKTAKQKA